MTYHVGDLVCSPSVRPPLGYLYEVALIVYGPFQTSCVFSQKFILFPLNLGYSVSQSDRDLTTRTMSNHAPANNAKERCFKEIAAPSPPLFQNGKVVLQSMLPLFMIVVWLLRTPLEITSLSCGIFSTGKPFLSFN